MAESTALGAVRWVCRYTEKRSIITYENNHVHAWATPRGSVILHDVTWAISTSLSVLWKSKSCKHRSTRRTLMPQSARASDLRWTTSKRMCWTARQPVSGNCWPGPSPPMLAARRCRQTDAAACEKCNDCTHGGQQNRGDKSPRFPEPHAPASDVTTAGNGQTPICPESERPGTIGLIRFSILDAAIHNDPTPRSVTALTAGLRPLHSCFCGRRSGESSLSSRLPGSIACCSGLLP